VRLVGVGVVGLGLGRHVKGPCRSGGASALDPACVGTLRLGTRKRSRRLAGGPMGCRRRGLLSAMRFGACRGGLFSSSSWAVHVLVRGLSGALRGRSAVARRRSASSGPTLFHPAFVSVFVRAFITVFGCIWCTVSLRRLHHLLSWFAPFPAPFAPFPAPFAPFPLRGQLAQWTVRAGKGAVVAPFTGRGPATSLRPQDLSSGRRGLASCRSMQDRCPSDSRVSRSTSRALRAQGIRLDPC
jgi:hypothetical protein